MAEQPSPKRHRPESLNSVSLSPEEKQQVSAPLAQLTPLEEITYGPAVPAPDFSIVTPTVRFRVHRANLGSFSPDYFGKLFVSDPEAKEVDFQSSSALYLTAANLKLFLDHLHDTTLVPATGNLDALMLLSDHFNTKALQVRCVAQLKNIKPWKEVDMVCKLFPTVVRCHCDDIVKNWIKELGRVMYYIHHFPQDHRDVQRFLHELWPLLSSKHTAALTAAALDCGYHVGQISSSLLNENNPRKPEFVPGELVEAKSEAATGPWTRAIILLRRKQRKQYELRWLNGNTDDSVSNEHIRKCG